MSISPFHNTLPGRLSVLLLAVLLLITACPPFCGLAGVRPAMAADEQVSMDFQNVDIQLLIKFMGELTGRNFIVDKGVAGKVSIYSPTPLGKDEAFEVFSSVLQVNGFTMVPSGKVIKIVPSSDARTEGTTAYSAKGASTPRGEYVTQIVPLRFATVKELAAVIAPLVSKGGLVTPYAPANSLILSDFAGNVRRLLDIIAQLDQVMYGMQLRVYPLHYATASDVATQMNKVLGSRQGGQQQGQTETTVVYDDRTSTVVALVPQGDVDVADGMVAALDKPTPLGRSDVQVIRLRNADAEASAKVLMELIERPSSEKDQKSLSRDVKVVADKASNSLIISAAPAEYEILRQTVEELDKPRRQVFVEALIMEVSSDQTFSYGVNWAGATSTDNGVLFGGSQTGTGSLDYGDSGTVFPAGGSIGYVMFPISIGGLTFNNLQSIISFSKTHNDFRVLSTPQLLTLDNEEATVTVAENIPYSTQLSSGDQVDDKTTQSFDYRDVGVILKMTPQISDNGSVKLKINQQVSKVVERQVTSDDKKYVVLAPTTRKREVDTTVLVRDGQTIVIAGLLERELQEGESSVPGLSDIPLLGNLFKYKTQTEGQKNLLVFLTPKVVEDEADAESILREKKVQRMQAEIGEDGMGLPERAPLILSGPSLGVR